LLSTEWRTHVADGWSPPVTAQVIVSSPLRDVSDAASRTVDLPGRVDPDADIYLGRVIVTCGD